MINDEANKCSSRWLRGKKETIIIGATDFEGALDDPLNYQNKPRKNIKIKALY